MKLVGKLPYPNVPDFQKSLGGVDLDNLDMDVRQVAIADFFVSVGICFFMALAIIGQIQEDT